jgi:hypothetical protein
LTTKIRGHKRTNDFYKYIRITPEEAANKIKELWFARGDMKLIKEAVGELQTGCDSAMAVEKVVHKISWLNKEDVQIATFPKVSLTC